MNLKMTDDDSLLDKMGALLDIGKGMCADAHLLEWQKRSGEDIVTFRPCDVQEILDHCRACQECSDCQISEFSS